MAKPLQLLLDQVNIIISKHCLTQQLNIVYKMDQKIEYCLRYQYLKRVLKMLLHSYHNLDTKIVLEASAGVNWYDVNAVFDTDNVTEIDYYPNAIGRWKYKNKY